MITQMQLIPVAEGETSFRVGSREMLFYRDRLCGG